MSVTNCQLYSWALFSDVGLWFLRIARVVSCVCDLGMKWIVWSFSSADDEPSYHKKALKSPPRFKRPKRTSCPFCIRFEGLSALAGVDVPGSESSNPSLSFTLYTANSTIVHESFLTAPHSYLWKNFVAVVYPFAFRFPLKWKQVDFEDWQEISLYDENLLASPCTLSWAALEM